MQAEALLHTCGLVITDGDLVIPYMDPMIPGVGSVIPGMSAAILVVDLSRHEPCSHRHGTLLAWVPQSVLQTLTGFCKWEPQWASTGIVSADSSIGVSNFGFCDPHVGLHAPGS